MAASTNNTHSESNEVVVSPPVDGSKINLNQFIGNKGRLLSKAKPVDVLILEDGTYELSEPIVINLPLELIAKNPGAVNIRGNNLPNYLLVFEGKGKLVLSGINISLDNQKRSNVILIRSGELEMDQCTVEGGTDPEITKRDFGAGLILKGGSTATISNCILKNNVMGVAVQDQSSVRLQSNKFTENRYGIVFRDQAQGDSHDNEYFENSAYGFMVYDDAKVKVTRDICHDNTGGFGFLFHSKAVIEASEAFENENHGFFINDWADVTIKGSKSYSNEFSGIAIYADSHSEIHDCECYDNSHSGVEIAEEAKSVLVKNKIYTNNDAGIYLDDSAEVEIIGNEIFGNTFAIDINGENILTVDKCKMYHNSDGSITYNMQSTLNEGENEVFENGDDYEGEEENEENEDDDGDSGVDLGSFFAKMFGSENISDDPNTIAIPLGHLFGGPNAEDDDDEDEQDSDVQSMNGFDPSQVVDVPQEECEALIALFKSTIHQLWSDSSNWLESPMVGEWYGVTVTDGHVTSLDLKDNRLIGTIPSELGNLPHLELLHFSGNQLSGPIPVELGQLTNLKQLALNTNQFSGNIPPELGNLTKLEMMSLYDNKLSGSIPPELGQLTNLTYLSLWENQLNGAIPPELGNLVLLEKLGLNGNQLSGPIPPDLGNLTHLLQLGLHDNQLTGTIPPEFGNLTNVQTLVIYKNQLSGSIPSELGKMNNIRLLYLNSNQLTGTIPPELGRLENLEQLSLSDNQLTGVISPELGKLTKLEQLALNSNHLEGEIPSEMGNLRNLEAIGLHENLLCGHIPLSFTNLTNLNTFAFFDTQLREPENKEFLAWKQTVSKWLGVSEEESEEITENQVSTTTLINSAFEKLQAEDLDGCIADTSEAIRLQPSALAYQIRGHAYATKDLQNEAITDFSDAILLDPDDPQNYAMRGVIFDKINDSRSAISDSQTFAELTDDEEMREGTLSYIEQLIVKMNELDSHNTENVTQNNPKKIELANLHIKRGMDLYEKMNWGGALKEYQIAKNLTPNSGLPYDLSWVIHYNEEDWDLAIANLLELIRISPNDAVAYMNLGTCKSKKGNLDDAVTDLIKATELDSANAEAHMKLGVVYLMRENYNLALEYLTRSIDLDPGVPVAYLHRASVKEKLKDYPAAIPDFEKYCQLGGSVEVPDLTPLREHIEYLKKEYGVPDIKQEEGRYSVILKSAKNILPERKIEVIKLIRNYYSTGLVESKYIAEKESVVGTDMTFDEASSMVRSFTDVGADAHLVKSILPLDIEIQRSIQRMKQLAEQNLSEQEEQNRKQAQYEMRKQKLQKEIEGRNLKLEQMKYETAQQVDSLRKERESLGFLAMGKKKEIDQKIISLERQVSDFAAKTEVLRKELKDFKP